jgi:hypothetical protein
MQLYPATTLMERRPTGCPSAAASALQQLSKYQRSCARSGRLHGRVRHAGPSFRVATRMTVPLRHGTTWHNGRSAESHPAHDHAMHHGPVSEPRPAEDHVAHNGRAAQRAFLPRLHHGRAARRAVVPRRHHGHWHAGAGTTGVWDRNRLIHPKADCHPRSPAAERFAVQLPRARHSTCAKKAPILRAKRSAGTAGWAAGFQVSIDNDVQSSKISLRANVGVSG